MKRKFLYPLVFIVVIAIIVSIIYIHGKNNSKAEITALNNSAVKENNLSSITNNSSDAKDNNIAVNSISNNTAVNNAANTSAGTNNTSSAANNASGSSGNTSNSSQNNTSGGTNNDGIGNSSTANSNNSVSKNKTYESYFGTWKITKKIKTTPIYGMSEKEIQEYTGKSIILSKDIFQDTYGSVQKPKYVISTVSGDDFYNGIKIKLSDIGVTDNSIEKITIYNPEGKIYNEIYLNDNSIIYFQDGVFFQTQR